MAMLIVGLIFLGVILIGQALNWLSHRRDARRPPPTNDPACRSSLAMRMARLVAALGAVTALGALAGLGWAGRGGDRRPEARPGRELHLAGLRRRPDGRSSAHLRRRAAGPDPRRPWRSAAEAPFLDIRNLVSFGGERGLLSIAFPPDYASSGRFYVYYTARSPDGAMTIAEFRRASADRAAPASRRIVLSIPHPRGNHNGGQLQFGPDGHLWIGTGDGGGAGDPDFNGQDLSSLSGKLLRIDPRETGAAPYSVPADNPFSGQSGRRGEIWAYGLRNPWRFSFDRETGDLVIGDVGQGDWEEIDFAPAPARGRGANFGWAAGKDGTCSTATPTSPAADHYPRRSRRPTVLALSRLLGHRRVRRPGPRPALRGRYVYGDYCRNPLWSVRLATPNAQDDRQLGLGVPGLSSFGEDACGRVYAISGDGPLWLEAEGASEFGLPPHARRLAAGCPRRRAPPRDRASEDPPRCRVGRVRLQLDPGKRPGGRPEPATRGPPGARNRVHLTVSRGRR